MYMLFIDFLLPTTTLIYIYICEKKMFTKLYK